MKFITQKYTQNDQEFYSIVMPFKEVNRISEVLVYGKTEYGYQRKPEKKHYLGIRNSLIQDGESLPTSIILSGNKDEVSNYLTPLSIDGHKNSNLFEFDSEQIKDKIFRIVDGQHRIYGLDEASQENPKFLDFPLNVIIVVTEDDMRYKEVVLFRDINSKAKKLKTDLTLLAMYNYELIRQQKLSNEDDLIKHLLVRTVHFLNENDESVWNSAIQFDIHEQPVQGIIGVAAMTNSVRPLVKKYISAQWGDVRGDLTYSKDIIELLNTHAQILSQIISEAWSYVESKWTGCFESTGTLFKGEPRYNKSYYIQKTTGTNAIHSILEENINFKKIGENDLFESYAMVINNSPLETDDWAVGGRLSGLTSKSGFSKAKRIIEIGFEKYEQEQAEKRREKEGK